MVGKGAPKGNRYAKKQGEGVGLNIYLSQTDIAFLQQKLRESGENPEQWRMFARRYAKSGIHREIKQYMDSNHLGGK